jgi:hypothetical protein
MSWDINDVIRLTHYAQTTYIVWLAERAGFEANS